MWANSASRDVIDLMRSPPFLYTATHAANAPPTTTLLEHPANSRTRPGLPSPHLGRVHGRVALLSVVDGGQVARLLHVEDHVDVTLDGLAQCEARRMAWGRSGRTCCNNVSWGTRRPHVRCRMQGSGPIPGARTHSHPHHQVEPNDNPGHSNRLESHPSSPAHRIQCLCVLPCEVSVVRQRQPPYPAATLTRGCKMQLIAERLRLVVNVIVQTCIPVCVRVYVPVSLANAGT